MTYPNTHPAPAMVYGGAPSFDEATAPNPFAVIADLRAGLDAAKRLREHLPGDSPELQQADDTIAALEAAIEAAGPAPPTAADLAERMALADELATLRADNAARGQVIEQLRKQLEDSENHAVLLRCDIENRLQGLMDESDGYMRERDQARAERDIARANVAAADRRNEVLAAELDTVRSERDAAREELTAALLARDEARAAFHRADCDRDRYRTAHNRTLRALNAALGEP